MDSPKTQIPPYNATEEQVAELVTEHSGWAASIARSVARSWNLDWQLDGLDGGAYEALIFCARRFNPTLGVPFRAYARRRIHEASTEEARKSKSWQRAVGANTQAEQDSREISARLFEVFPELRDGLLPAADDDGDDPMRGSVRQLLTSASMIAALQELTRGGAEAAMDYKRMIEIIADMEHVHQAIIWGIYYQGQSMRAVAEDWEIDELNVIREHKEIIQYVFAKISNPKKVIKKPKVRPGLRAVAQTLKKRKDEPPFARFINSAAALIAVFNLY